MIGTNNMRKSTVLEEAVIGMLAGFMVAIAYAAFVLVFGGGF